MHSWNTTPISINGMCFFIPRVCVTTKERCVESYTTSPINSWKKATTETYWDKRIDIYYAFFETLSYDFMYMKNFIAWMSDSITVFFEMDFYFKISVYYSRDCWFKTLQVIFICAFSKRGDVVISPWSEASSESLLIVPWNETSQERHGFCSVHLTLLNAWCWVRIKPIKS